MPESNQTTFEEASRCPKCQHPGEVGSVREQYSTNQDAMVKLNVLFCRNQVCPWYNTSWIVQVNPDGSIPQAYEQLGPKQYPKLSPETETRIRENIQAQLEAETKPGTEVRNPHST